MKAKSGFLVLCVAMILAGCETTPKEINGRKVIGSKWVNGKVVYVLAPDPHDADEMKRVAEEMDAATKDMKVPTTTTTTATAEPKT